MAWFDRIGQQEDGGWPRRSRTGTDATTTGGGMVGRSPGRWGRSWTNSQRMSGRTRSRPPTTGCRWGLAMALEHPARARRLLALIEAEEAERLALVEDA